MHGGTIVSGYNKQLGYYTQVTTDVNGESITVMYSHLQESGRTLSGTVAAGEIIGLSGTSGNLKNALKNGAEQHVHIEAWNGDYIIDKSIGTRNDLSNRYPNHVDPSLYMTTKFDTSLNPINPC